MSDDSEVTRASAKRAKAADNRESTKIDKPARVSAPALAKPSDVSFGSRYKVLGTLGKGGMGEVYRAIDTELETEVALKVVLPDEANADESLARFRREVALARKVTDANVLRVYDLDTHEGRLFLSMEYVDGVDLAAMMKEGKQPLAKALAIFRQICSGLAAAHGVGIVHRDLKPQNVLVDKDGRVRIADFGLARAIGDAGLTVSGTVLGSPAYMSPEQVKGDPVDERSDIYSLGVILYQLVTGDVPFTGPNAHAVMSMRLHKPPRPPRELDAETPVYIEAITLRCLAVDPRERYQSVRELVADLDAARAPARSGRRKGVVWGAAAFAALATGAVVWKVAARSAAENVATPPATFAGSASTAATAGVTSDRTAVLILGFENRTNDPTFDAAIDKVVEYGLRQSKQLDPISGFDLRDLANDLGSEPLPLDDHLAAEVAKHDRRRIVSVRGSVVAKGAGFVLSINAVDTAGNALLTTTAHANSLADVVPEVQHLVIALRAALGDTSAKSEPVRTGLSDNLEADHEYAIAYASGRAGDSRSSILHLTQALARDPGFPTAHQALAGMYARAGRETEANQEYDLAIRAIDKMTDRDRLRFLGDYYLGITGDVDRAIATYRELLATWPYEIAAQVNLSAAYQQRGDLRQALELTRPLAREHPHDRIYRANLVVLELGAGDFEEALTASRKAFAELTRPVDSMHLYAAAASYLLGRKSDALAEYASFEHGDASAGRIARVDLAMAEGRLAEARTTLDGAIREDLAAGNVDAVELEQAMLAEVQLRRGDKAGALAAAAKVVKAPHRLFIAAVVQLAAGDDKRAAATRAKLAKDVASDTRFLSKLLDAEAERVHGRPDQAILLAQDALKISDGWIGHFVLARAALDAGRFADAYAEITKLQARRGEVALDVDDSPMLRYVPPLTYYLARVQEGLHSADAAASYQAFLDMEPQADRDPLVEDAKRRHAALVK